MVDLARAVLVRAAPPARPRSRVAALGKKMASEGVILRLCSFLILLGLWGLVVSLPATRKIPGPLDVARALLSLEAGVYVRAALVSLLRVLVGFVIATVVGVPLGMAVGYWRTFREFTFPAIEFLRPIPPIAWIPLSVLFFTSTEAQIVFLIFYGALFPIVYNTSSGVSGVNLALVRAARSLGANQRQVFRRIVLPAALPAIFTGLTIAMGVTWLMVVAAEMIASKGGLGYLTWEAYTTLNYPLIFVGMGAIGVVGALSSIAIRLVARRMTRWKKRS